MARRTAAVGAALLAAGLLAGCAAERGESRTVGTGDLGRCGGFAYVPYIGHPLILPEEPTPTDGGYLSAAELPPDSRVVAVGDAPAGPPDPDRLTVAVEYRRAVYGDAVERIIRRLSCG